MQVANENAVKFKLIRNVTTEECDWIDRDFSKGEEVFKYTSTISNNNNPWSDCCIACSIDGPDGSYYELPADALKRIGR